MWRFATFRHEPITSFAVVAHSFTHHFRLLVLSTLADEREMVAGFENDDIGNNQPRTHLVLDKCCKKLQSTL